METTEIKTGIFVRCPEWAYCTVTKCSHTKIHTPNTNCYYEAHGSIRPPECPNCREEGK